MGDSQWPCRGWSERDDARLYVLLAEGLSSRQIGDRMGRSKNSVLARVHRRGWKLPIAPIGGPQRITTSGKYASPKSPPSPPVVVPDTAPEPLPPAAPIASLACPALPVALSAVTTCQYPKGDRPDWQFCGEPVVFGGPYCARCRAICWQAPPRWQRVAA